MTYDVRTDRGKLVTIHTRNGNNRPLLYWFQLTESERKEFDYLDTDEKQDSTQFFRYRGNTYDVGEFCAIPYGAEEFKGFDGYSPDSFFSGILIKFTEDNDCVQPAWYCS